MHEDLEHLLLSTPYAGEESNEEYIIADCVGKGWTPSTMP